MNQSFKYTLTNNWHSMRWVALGVGTLFVGMGAWHADIVSVLLGGFFLFQAATNTGCLGGNCTVPIQATDKSESDSENVEFTEINEKRHG